MIIRTIITFIISIPALFLTMRHNMHMFQLNGYKNGEHLRWLKKNIRQQWLLILMLVHGVNRLVFPAFAHDIMGWINLLLIILVYNAMRRLNKKKKLVYT
ncbi:MAG: hypothetical protein IKT17_08220, partial [Lachnospiraceae bacterium]|nr:hypothetical protein [Lachnospiraceae bacterium]